MECMHRNMRGRHAEAITNKCAARIWWQGMPAQSGDTTLRSPGMPTTTDACAHAKADAVFSKDKRNPFRTRLLPELRDIRGPDTAARGYAHRKSQRKLALSCESRQYMQLCVPTSRRGAARRALPGNCSIWRASRSSTQLYRQRRRRHQRCEQIVIGHQHAGGVDEQPVQVLMLSGWARSSSRRWM